MNLTLATLAERGKATANAVSVNTFITKNGGPMRKHGRTDANQAEIVKALEAMGASVQSLAAIGNGCPDLLVGYKDHDFKFEVKDGNKPPSRRGLTPDQVKWHTSWKGRRPYVVSSPEDAVARLELLTG